MAIFRKIHTSIWSDAFFSELDNEKKLFYLYLLTNERTKQCGVYEITKRQISFDLLYSIDRVSELIKYFILENKIRYNEATKEIALANWLKYNSSTSPKVKTCINKEFSLVKDTVLIEYVKGIYTLSQEEQEQEPEQFLYTEKDFLERWKAARLHYDKKPTNISELEPFEKVNFNKIIKTYTPKQIDEAIGGFFTQDTYKATRLRPTHFLELNHFEKYLTCWQTNEVLFPKKLKSVERL